MKRALTLLAALTLGTVPLAAQATTAPTLTLTQQARKAAIIVRATLGTSTRVTEGDVTWVVYPLTVGEAVVGDPATLPQREGKPALYLLAGLEGVPELRAGQEGFFLLYGGRLDSPLVGFSQGFYPIVNGQVTRPGATAADTASTGTGTVTATTPAAATGTATTPATPATTGTAGTPPTATTPTTSGTTTPTAPSATGTTGTTTTGAAGTTSTAATPPTTPPATPSTPATTTPAATTPTTPADSNAFPTDPAAFRDALRAARGGQ
ncbi:hypothetical protein F8S09_05955 [Deinococcus sp. SDU3-2]|uniref:Uncharacterized protein n=1 Tax=Deinococcus terrestris TaxID=2651870 RepID=A0A7X1NV61_9DEIO|nr:hypothetical protein [Deinococcus terrestris]MPY66243.1 hypothetical protein [Deinococcus terrestris]